MKKHASLDMAYPRTRVGGHISDKGSLECTYGELRRFILSNR